MIGDKLQKLGAREKKWLALLALVLAVLAIDGLVVSPLLARLRDFDAQFATLEGQVALDRSILLQEPAVSRAFASVASYIESDTKPSEAIDRLKAEVDDLARQVGLVITSMEQREPRRSEYYDLYVVEIGSFEGEIPQLVRFLRDIGEKPGMLRIVKLNFESAPDGARVRGSMLISKAIVRSA